MRVEIIFRGAMFSHPGSRNPDDTFQKTIPGAPMPRIIFIRPAETDHCLYNTILGRFDPDLNETGTLNARMLANALERWPISFIAASPLKRSLATAIPIEDIHEVLVRPIPAFHAGDMGDWDNRSLNIIKQSDRGRYETWFKDPDFPAPGGESMREVYARAFPEFANIIHHTNPEETLAFVLQDSVLRAMCCAVLDLPLEAAQRFYMDHAAFGVFERIYPGGPYHMVAWNRTEHLLNTHMASLELEEELPGV